ncbi:MAG: hypothetical protein EOP43_07265 [Sphingobacteriaceae bacterium]|nr:MAG: hypothetical protein EOP43_07265 [Sphingobacteriaceae bacterium]
MTYNIQPEFDCRACVKCGQRPVVEQVKKLYKIKCLNKDCNNAVGGTILNFLKWNELNKPRENTNRKEDNDAIKRTA